jgi:fructokinase
MFLVCGEALFDIFVGDGRPDTGVALEARAGGSPYNVAIGLARLGTASALLTGVSRDVLGEKLAGQLTAEGVETRYLVRSGHRTTLSLVGLDARGHPAYTFYGVDSADCSLTEADLPRLDANVTGLHFGSYSIAVAPTADTFAALAARETHRFISLDPNIRPTIKRDMTVWRRRIDALLPHVTLVKCSREDLEALYPGRKVADVARAWMRQGLGPSRVGPSLVIVTDGAAGAHAFTQHWHLHRPATPITVIDTVGAGDSFQSALLHSLILRNLASRDAMAVLPIDTARALIDMAIAAASITCSRRSADPPRAADLAAYVAV